MGEMPMIGIPRLFACERAIATLRTLKNSPEPSNGSGLFA